jgi:hypothetical protein
MHEYKRTIIDNWSLMASSQLISAGQQKAPFKQSPFSAIMSFSNMVTAILLYDDIMYLPNGNEQAWKRDDWFSTNIESYIKPADISQKLLDDAYDAPSNMDHSTSNYFHISRELQADLFLNPVRSQMVFEHLKVTPNGSDMELLRRMDAVIKDESNKSWSEDVKIGVQSNFILPQLTQYVLSKCSSTDDILKVLFEIKTAGSIDDLKSKIQEVSCNLRDFSKFQQTVENLVKQHLGYASKNTGPWSIKFNAFFLSFSKSFNVVSLRDKKLMVFLKDILSSRTEVQGLSKSIQRVFGDNVFEALLRDPVIAKDVENATIWNKKN